METLAAALISGGLALLGTVITVTASQRKTESTMKTEMAVLDNEVKNLRKEVEKHNNFAARIPKLEEFKEEALERLKRLEDFRME